jgi:hypothetical protein
MDKRTGRTTKKHPQNKVTTQTPKSTRQPRPSISHNLAPKGSLHRAKPPITEPNPIRRQEKPVRIMKNMGREIFFFQERIIVAAKLILQKTLHKHPCLLTFCPP